MVVAVLLSMSVLRLLFDIYIGIIILCAGVGVGVVTVSVVGIVGVVSGVVVNVCIGIGKVVGR